MSNTRSAADRIYDLFHAVRETHEVWSDGNTDYIPVNPDALRYLQNHNVRATERQRLTEIIDDIIAQHRTPGPATAKMVAWLEGEIIPTLQESRDLAAAFIAEHEPAEAKTG